jgi:hypothetical protein
MNTEPTPAVWLNLRLARNNYGLAPRAVWVTSGVFAVTMNGDLWDHGLWHHGKYRSALLWNRAYQRVLPNIFLLPTRNLP